MTRLEVILCIALIIFAFIAVSNRPASVEPATVKESLTTETYKITAYCPCEKCCGRWADGITASGHEIQKGDKFCAADSSIPFGTTIDIPEYGRVPVLDRGGAIKGNRIDVYFDTHQEALNWGVMNLVIKEFE